MSRNDQTMASREQTRGLSSCSCPFSSPGSQTRTNIYFRIAFVVAFTEYCTYICVLHSNGCVAIDLYCFNYFPNKETGVLEYDFLNISLVSSRAASRSRDCVRTSLQSLLSREANVLLEIDDIVHLCRIELKVRSFSRNTRSHR